MHKFLVTLAISSSCFAGFSSPELGQIDLLPSYWQNINEPTLINQFAAFANTPASCLKPALAPFNEQDIREMMQTQGGDLSASVINKVISTLKCAQHYNIDHNQILTIIDYSLPSNQKRLWIFDLNDRKLLFHTYVSHGIKSGELLTNYFSNKNNSRSTSIGVYTTNQSYYGRDGLSLRLDGLDRGFNDNASGRSIVMHGGWYVEENFIKKYGRAGRSWGCPAVPLDMTKSIINTIKDKSIFVAYYPSDNWFSKSKFLKCDLSASTTLNSAQINALANPQEERREDVLFVEPSKHNQQLDTRPVLAMPADKYTQLFHVKAPLTRMLRRQINNIEYIALSNTEFKTLVENHYKNSQASTLLAKPASDDGFDSIHLIAPVLKMIRGYYETQMKIVELGKLKDVTLKDAIHNSYTLHFDKNTIITIYPTNAFVRWVGL